MSASDLDQWDFEAEPPRCEERHPSYDCECLLPIDHYGNCRGWIDDFGAIWWRSAKFQLAPT